MCLISMLLQVRHIENHFEGSKQFGYIIAFNLIGILFDNVIPMFHFRLTERILT